MTPDHHPGYVHLARELGINLLAEDVPKLLQLIYRVQAEEREACARVCDQSASLYSPLDPISGAYESAAQKIRARGQA